MAEVGDKTGLVTQNNTEKIASFERSMEEIKKQLGKLSILDRLEKYMMERLERRQMQPNEEMPGNAQLIQTPAAEQTQPEVDFDYSQTQGLSAMDRIEKLIQKPEERFREQNLWEKEDEKTNLLLEEESFRLKEMERKETPQPKGENQTGAKLEKNACQVFDRIILRGKGVIRQRMNKFIKAKRKKKKKRSRLKKDEKKISNPKRYGNHSGNATEIKLKTDREPQNLKRLCHLKKSSIGKLVGKTWLLRLPKKKKEPKAKGLMIEFKTGTKKKKRTRLEEQKSTGIKPNSCGKSSRNTRGTKLKNERDTDKFNVYIHQWGFAKLLNIKAVMKKLETWKKRKQKRYQHNKRNIKERFSGNHLTHGWNLKLVAEIFGEKSSGVNKEKPSCEFGDDDRGVRKQMVQIQELLELLLRH